MGKYHLAQLGVDGRIILIQIFEKHGV